MTLKPLIQVLVNLKHIYKRITAIILKMERKIQAHSRRGAASFFKVKAKLAIRAQTDRVAPSKGALPLSKRFHPSSSGLISEPLQLFLLR